MLGAPCFGLTEFGPAMFVSRLRIVRRIHCSEPIWGCSTRLTLQNKLPNKKAQRETTTCLERNRCVIRTSVRLNWAHRHPTQAFRVLLGSQLSVRQNRSSYCRVTHQVVEIRGSWIHRCELKAALAAARPLVMISSWSIELLTHICNCLVCFHPLCVASQ